MSCVLFETKHLKHSHHYDGHVSVHTSSKKGDLSREPSKLEKLEAEKDALDQQLRAFATEREKLISDNAYLDNLVESLQNQLDGTCAISPTTKYPVESSDPGQSVRCARCLRLLVKLRDYRNLYGKLVYHAEKCNDDASTTNSSAEDKGCDCEFKLSDIQCVPPVHKKTRKFECNNSACNKQSLQTNLKSSTGTTQQKTGDSDRSTPEKNSPCGSSACLNLSEPGTEQSRAVGVNQTVDICGIPKTRFDELRHNEWDCTQETIANSWEDSVLETTTRLLKFPKGATCRESQLSKALKQKSILCRSLYTQNAILVSKLAATQSRLRVALRALRLSRVRSAVSRPVWSDESQGKLTISILNVRTSFARQLEVLLQAKDVRGQSVFSKLPFTVKRKKSLIKQTATSLHSGQLSQSSSARANQSEGSEFSDSCFSPEMQCHVGNIVSPAREPNECDQPCENQVASMNACLPSPLVLAKQRNNCLVQQVSYSETGCCALYWFVCSRIFQLRVARSAKIGLKRQAIELTVQLKKALNSLHQSRHQQERSKRIIQHLMGYMHSLDSILKQFEEESTIYQNEANFGQAAQASPAENCEMIDAKVETVCSKSSPIFCCNVCFQRNPFEFSHTLAMRLRNALRTKQQLWAEMRERVRTSAQQEVRRRALIEELRDNLCQSRERQKQIKAELDKKTELLEVARITEDRLRSEIESQRTRLKTLQKEKSRLVHELDSCQEAHNFARSQLAELQRRLTTLSLTARTDNSQSVNDCRLAADGVPCGRQHFQAGCLNQFASYVMENLSKLALQVLKETEQTLLKPHVKQPFICSTTRQSESPSG
ncbi:uncharacterized protein DEA37_0011766 [Paragonimus westermani]|uniref:Uncharacterized protein n=1 Tax=Paragonimus westermani TaxID=34504 RepID=A0A5J4NTA0_9TREM|nr:uncharacterized protein DEA37_0011766 [Paragonimus westermani]